MSTEQNKAIVRRIYDEIINQGNFEVADELFASEYVYRSPGTPDLRGPDGFKELIGGYRSAFPDLHMTVQEMIAEGDSVASRWTAEGTHQGELMGIAPTGRHASIAGLIVTRLAGGKAVEDFEIFDVMGLLQQLGAMPMAEEPVAAGR